LPYVRTHIHQEAYGKNSDALLQRMGKRKDGGISQPEEDDSGIEGIDDKARCEDPGYISFAEPGGIPFRIRGQVHLFKEYEVNAHGYQEAAAAIADGFGMFQQLVHQFCKRITEHDQHDIADPYSGYKTKTSFMPAVEALFDNGKNNRPHRQGKNKTQCQSFQY